jgi:predicted ATPase/DNA-binding winged helix-turn-helix (wHTH) protein
MSSTITAVAHVPDAPAIVEFGRFRVEPHRRELLADGRPIKLGGRAFDLLMVLIEASGRVVSKDELMRRVWAGRIVEENSLQGAISALRKAFGADRALVRTVAGRGYQFTGEIRARSAGDSESEVPGAAPTAAEPPRRLIDLPEPVSELIGREAELSEVSDLVTTQRLVTLIGEGGIGKTRLGLEVARHLLSEFPDGVRVAELAPLSDPELVPVTVATALGLEFAEGAISAEGVANALGAKQLMLVLDNCEHVIDAAARMAGALLRTNSAARVLATSREPLRTEGECLYRVPSLAVPAEGTEDTEQLLRYGAVRLFVARARAADPHFSPDSRIAAAIAGICRRLDGIPLAIELAAARGGVLGIPEIAARLDDRFHLLTGGHRTALPRHQTLRATLDWSYELLPEPERVMLRRLAIFAGGFTLTAANAVAVSAEFAASDVVDGVANLVAKSLVAADVGGAIARYRLLETTRAYALEKLAESGEIERIARRHAECYRDSLAAVVQDKTATDDWRAAYAPEIDNLRAALAWAFAPGGDAAIGVALAAASAPVWLGMSLLTECHNWTGKAVASLDPSGRGTRHEMQLQAALGFSLMLTKGMTGDAHAALTRAFELAENLDDPDFQLQTLFGLCVFRIRLADYRNALELARQCEAVADRVSDAGARPTADWTLGVSLFFLGNLASSRTHLQRVCDGHRSASRRAEAVRFGFDRRIHALGILGMIRWLQGFPDRAIQASLSAMDEAQTLEHPVSLCIATWTGSVLSLWLGDLAAAERSTAILLDHTEKHSLDSFHPLGLGFAGELSATRGDFVVGVRLLRACLDGLRDARFQTFYGVFLGDLAKAVAATGNVEEGLATIDEALGLAERSGEAWYMPELLRIKGEVLLSRREPNAIDAEDQFLQSLAWARRQGALSWELRSATSLARLWRDQARTKEAHDLLAPVYDQFTEGFDTVDVKAAKALVESLR